MTANNPNLDLINTNAYIKFGGILLILTQAIEWKRSSDKGQNSITNLRKLTDNIPNLNLVNIKSNTKFGQNLSIFSQDTEQKRNSCLN